MGRPEVAPQYSPREHGRHPAMERHGIPLNTTNKMKKNSRVCSTIRFIGMVVQWIESDKTRDKTIILNKIQ